MSIPRAKPPLPMRLEALRRPVVLGWWFVVAFFLHQSLLESLWPPSMSDGHQYIRLGGAVLLLLLTWAAHVVESRWNVRRTRIRTGGPGTTGRQLT